MRDTEYDLCMHCGRYLLNHVKTQCLYTSTLFTARRCQTCNDVLNYDNYGGIASCWDCLPHPVQEE